MLRQEYVLVQAWKKAHDYVRAHNWYADVLELDLSNARLPLTIRHLQDELKDHQSISPSLARLVLAPKSTPWEIRNGEWCPKKGERQKLRPLAHLPIRDQTLATAFLLCMADVVETAQGNPTWPLHECRTKGMVSYGHRLLCDQKPDALRCRWGNAVYYRGHFDDYREFIRRPDEIVREDFQGEGNWAIVQADLSQFYDRVRPLALFEKVTKLFRGRADDAFFRAFQNLFCWRWHKWDVVKAREYASNQSPKIEQFEEMALPQGLAASGFFANLFLLDLDQAVWGLRHQSQRTGWSIVDYCRYVDDIRLVLRLPAEKSIDSESLKQQVTAILQTLASQHATGMLINENKTDVLLGRNEASRVIVFSDTMTTIQHRVSGAIDLAGGGETLTMIEGLFAAEPEESPLVNGERDTPADGDPFFSAVRDVKDETVARFSANRFKKTFRAMRVMAPEAKAGHSGPIPSRAHLDHRAAYFAQRLIWRWAKDPSNVRLLRISLELNADPAAAQKIIDLIRPHIIEAKSRGSARRVAEYCAAELFKAAATELGLSVERSQLPATADPQKVQQLFATLAAEVVGARAQMPWYLVQQALLLLAATGRVSGIDGKKSKRPEWRHYLVLHEFLHGGIPVKTAGEIVQFALAAGCFDNEETSSLYRLAGWLNDPLGDNRSADVVKILLEEDVGSAERLWVFLEPTAQEHFRHLFAAYGIGISQALEVPVSPPVVGSQVTRSVAQVSASPINPFQHEFLALKFLSQILQQDPQFEGQMTPWTVNITADWDSLRTNGPQFLEGRFTVQRNIPAFSDVPAYATPSWLQQSDQWRFRAGQILRALVVGRLDFTATTHSQRKPGFPRYQPYRSHWYRRRYGLFNGRLGLGPDWLPVSSWFCALLSRLLAWPGFALEADETGLSENPSKEAVLKCVNQRLEFLKQVHGKSSHTPIITHAVTLRAFKAHGSADSANLPFRVAVVQTVIPGHQTLLGDLNRNVIGDPELGLQANRENQREHLSSALAALASMLRLRETHQSRGGRLDLLVLPELSVHVDDVDTFLIPFARQHRCMVFAGLIYHRLLNDPVQPLVNAGVWLLPTESSSGGLRLERVKQGKWHLAPAESDVPHLMRWRPCQHLIQLHAQGFSAPIWTFTGSICYDATDLALASDLRNLSDSWVVPALNNGVQRFDTMVAALHYHMFQHVILCNTGEFGGSTAQAPFENRHMRTIFHHHGNAQAAITFLEIELDQYRAGRDLDTPPAGVTRHGFGNP